MIGSFPKIFQLGSPYIPNIFTGVVEVTEKIDGSQFAFGKDSDGNTVMRSKGKELFFDCHDKMFGKAIEFVRSVEDKLIGGTYFYAEYLAREKHNTLCYGRVPKNNLILFGVSVNGLFMRDYCVLEAYGRRLDLEVVALLYSGEVNPQNGLTALLEKESVLGKEKVEGVVVKNYDQIITLGGAVIPSFGKFVREEFKERHDKDWKTNQSKKGQFDTFLESFRTEARWNKAVQHLRDQGMLTNEPKDIGLLMKEIAIDLLVEETELIRIKLFDMFKEQIIRKAQSGLPDWYKQQLLARSLTPVITKEEQQCQKD